MRASAIAAPIAARTAQPGPLRISVRPPVWRTADSNTSPANVGSAWPVWLSPSEQHRRYSGRFRYRLGRLRRKAVQLVALAINCELTLLDQISL